MRRRSRLAPEVMTWRTVLPRSQFRRRNDHGNAWTPNTTWSHGPPLADRVAKINGETCMLKELFTLRVAGLACTVCLLLSLGTLAVAQEKSKPASLPQEDQAALEIGRKVIAVRKAIQNPQSAMSMPAVKDLGRDQRYYVMVRGWLVQQLQGDLSIRESRGKQQTPDAVEQRIGFLKKAIRAIDLE